MHVRMYVCMYVRICTNVYMYVYVCACIFVYMYGSMYECIYFRQSVCPTFCVCIGDNASIFVCVYVPVHITDYLAERIGF